MQTQTKCFLKKHIIFSIVFLGGMLLAAQGLLAQTSNKIEQRLIHINGKGDVIDDRGTKLGYISKEDMVFNHQGQKIGFIKGGKVYDAEGNSLGKAKKDGRYYNNDGVFVLQRPLVIPVKSWTRRAISLELYIKTTSFMHVPHTVSFWSRK